MHKFRELKVWQRAMGFVTEIYRVSAGFPRSECFGLTSHIRRAASSIPLNIAEGAGAGYDAHFRQFLSVPRCASKPEVLPIYPQSPYLRKEKP